MRNNIIIEKLIAYSEKIQDYCVGLDYDQFCRDTKLVEACVFNLGQMGELATGSTMTLPRVTPRSPGAISMV